MDTVVHVGIMHMRFLRMICRAVCVTIVAWCAPNCTSGQVVDLRGNLIPRSPNHPTAHRDLSQTSASAYVWIPRTYNTRFARRKLSL